MLFRKIRSIIVEHLKSNSSKILLIDGARQVGKTFIVRDVATSLFTNFIEINMIKDYEGPKLFANVHTIEDFYLQLRTFAGDKMGIFQLVASEKSECFRWILKNFLLPTD